jgi:hypothetical protein
MLLQQAAVLKAPQSTMTIDGGMEGGGEHRCSGNHGGEAVVAGSVMARKEEAVAGLVAEGEKDNDR